MTSAPEPPGFELKSQKAAVGAATAEDHLSAPPRMLPQNRFSRIFAEYSLTVLAGSLVVHLCLIGLALFLDRARQLPSAASEIPIELVSEEQAKGTGPKQASGQDQTGSGPKGLQVKASPVDRDHGGTDAKADQSKQAESKPGDASGRSADKPGEKAGAKPENPSQTAQQAKAEEVKAEEAKAEEVKAEEAKAAAAKVEEMKAEEAKAQEAQAQQAQAQQAQAQEAKTQEAKAQDAKLEESKDQPRSSKASKPGGDHKAEQNKAGKPGAKPEPKSQAKAASALKSAAKSDFKPEPEAKTEPAAKPAPAQAQPENVQREQAVQSQPSSGQEPAPQQAQAPPAAGRAPPPQEAALAPAQAAASAQLPPQERMPSFLQPMDNFSQAVAAPMPTDDQNAEPVSYKVLVFSLLERAKQIPETARRRHASGHVVVSFGIDDSGQPQEISLVQSSGQADLDVEGLALIVRAAPFPVPPAGAQRVFAVDIGFNS